MGAHSIGRPKVRVRRLPDHGRLFLRRPRYEVEVTPVGQAAPEPTTVTERPYSLIKPLVGGYDDAAMVLKRADGAWVEGTVGPWVSMFRDDEGDPAAPDGG